MVRLWLLLYMSLVLSGGNAGAELMTPEEAHAVWLVNYKHEHAHDLQRLTKAVDNELRIRPNGFEFAVTSIDPNVVKQVSESLRSKGWIVTLTDNTGTAADDFVNTKMFKVEAPLKEETK